MKLVVELVCHDHLKYDLRLVTVTCLISEKNEIYVRATRGGTSLSGCGVGSGHNQTPPLVAPSGCAAPDTPPLVPPSGFAPQPEPPLSGTMPNSACQYHESGLIIMIMQLLRKLLV